MFNRHTIIVVLLLLLPACGMMPPLDSGDASGGVTGDGGIDTDGGLQLPPRAVDSSHPAEGASAVDQLLAEADKALAAQDSGKAAALVERALRVAPKDPRAYFTLAQIRYRQGQRHQVALLIQKARAFASNDKALLASISRFQQSLSQ